MSYFTSPLLAMHPPPTTHASPRDNIKTFSGSSATLALHVFITPTLCFLFQSHYVVYFPFSSHNVSVPTHVGLLHSPQPVVTFSRKSASHCLHTLQYFISYGYTLHNIIRWCRMATCISTANLYNDCFE